MATPEETRNTGIYLILGGLFAAALLIVLIVVGATSHPKNDILIDIGSIGLLLPAYLIGYGIIKIVNSASST